MATPEILLDTHTEWPNRCFSLSCRCGGGFFSVSGEIRRNTLIDQDVVSGEVTGRCKECRRRALLFDPCLHGYDVELGHFPPTRGARARPQDFECPKCRLTSFALTARFEYPEALVDAVERGVDAGYPSHAGREQDLFTWFTLVGRCSGCGSLVTVASFECA